MKNLLLLLFAMIIVTSCSPTEPKAQTASTGSQDQVAETIHTNKTFRGLSIKAALSDGDDFSIVR